MSLITIKPPFGGQDFGAQGVGGASAGTFRVLCGQVNPNSTTDTSVTGAAIGSTYSWLGASAGSIFWIRTAQGTSADWSALA